MVVNLTIRETYEVWFDGGNYTDGIGSYTSYQEAMGASKHFLSEWCSGNPDFTVDDAPVNVCLFQDGVHVRCLGSFSPETNTKEHPPCAICGGKGDGQNSICDVCAEYVLL